MLDAGTIPAGPVLEINSQRYQWEFSYPGSLTLYQLPLDPKRQFKIAKCTVRDELPGMDSNAARSNAGFVE